MQPKKTDAIITFLKNSATSLPAGLYNYGMEVQVNVAQDGGERVEGEYKGHKWNGWSDGLTTWKPFRIPWNANKKPEYEDSEMNYDLAKHVEAIGMTGWCWKELASHWVAFDFDSIINHKEGLTPEELDAIIAKVQDIPWVSILRSTSGLGYHIYVFLPKVQTNNHNEHAALARSILGHLSALTGTDFQSKVDCCGGNMWVWHRKSRNTHGFELIKKGTVLTDIPPNWKDHLQVITGTRRKNVPTDITDADPFDILSGQRTTIKLDEEHQRLINYLEGCDNTWWWDNDNQMLVTHTMVLKKAYDELDLIGSFETTSAGTDVNEQNCFCFPLSGGAWAVRRFTRGVAEAKTWQQDGQGWTKCYLNRESDFHTACRANNGVLDPKGNYVFREAEEALEALKLLNIFTEIDPRLRGRRAKLIQNGDYDVIIEIDHESSDPTDQMDGWLIEKNKPWTKVARAGHRVRYEPETLNYDEVIRHLISAKGYKDIGWALKSNNWQEEPKSNIKDYLKSLGHKAGEVDIIVGTQIAKPWLVVSKPYQPEYPGNREWNREAAQFKYSPSEGEYDTWLSVLRRCGEGLNDAVKEDAWCKMHGIINGADYLKCWVASLFQYPEQPLPYIFLFGPQNSGKSIFFESIGLLTTGVMDASAAMINNSNFNKELEGVVLCFIDEKDLSKQSFAYNRIKDWVTARDLLVHGKGDTPYLTTNYTHWIHCANDPKYCPVFPGDTRITMTYVSQLDPMDMIPKEELLSRLKREAGAFLRAVLSLELPAANDRLRIPVIVTSEKVAQQRNNKTDLELFFEYACKEVSGNLIKFSDFYDRFQSQLDPNEIGNWSKIKVGKLIPTPYVKGRSTKNAQQYIANIAWREDNIEAGPKYKLVGEFLTEVDDG